MIFRGQTSKTVKQQGSWREQPDETVRKSISTYEKDMNECSKDPTEES